MASCRRDDEWNVLKGREEARRGESVNVWRKRRIEGERILEFMVGDWSLV